MSRLNDLIAVLNQTSSHLSSSSEDIQAFMGKASGAVQNVVCISQGQATQALLETWLFSCIDGNQVQTGMSSVATQLNTAASTLQEHVQAVSNGMQSLAIVQSNGGVATPGSAPSLQSDVNALTNRLNDMSIALDGAAKIIHAMNSNWPAACATGFLPGSSTYPTFAPNAFDPLYDSRQMNMAQDGAEASMDPAIQQEIDALVQSNVEQVTDALSQIEDIQPGLWETLTFDQRLRTLEKVEDEMLIALDFNIGPADLEVKDLGNTSG